MPTTSRNLGGRPCRLTTATALRIVGSVARGATRAQAAREAGVGPSTLFRWQARGRAGEEPFKAFEDTVKAVEQHHRWGIWTSAMGRLIKGGF